MTRRNNGVSDVLWEMYDVAKDGVRKGSETAESASILLLIQALEKNLNEDNIEIVNS